MKNKMNKEMKNLTKSMGNWLFKIDFLKEEIDKLGKLENWPIISISTFLLKCQVIEFELKHLIYAFDFHLDLKNSSDSIKRHIRTPNELNDLTLGQSIRIFSEFEAIAIDKLKNQLKSIVTLRNDFTHHLFSQKGNIKELIEDAKRGIVIANSILSKLKELDTIV